MNNELRLGYKLYIVALLFSSLAMFFQVLPLDTSAYFQQTLGISASKVINLTSLYFVTYAIMQIPGGILFDKFGLKYVLPLSIFITMSGCALYWVSSNSLTLGLSRLLTGTGCSVAYISGIFIAIKFLPPKWLPLFIGVMESGSTSGSLIAATPLKSLLNNFGWNATASIVTGFCLLLLILSLVLVRKLNHTARSTISIGAAFKSSFSLLKNKSLVAVFIYSFATWLVTMSFAGYWLKDYLIHVHAYSESQSLNLIQLYWASFMVSSVIVSLLAKDFTSSKLAVCILSGIGFVTYATMSIPVVFNYLGTAMVVMLGAISATGVIVAFSVVPKIAPPESSGAVVAMNNTFIVLGGFSGQILFGYVLEHMNIANIAVNYDFKNLETHYYSGLLLYPVFTLIAFVAIIYAMFGACPKSIQASEYSHDYNNLPDLADIPHHSPSVLKN